MLRIMKLPAPTSPFEDMINGYSTGLLQRKQSLANQNQQITNQYLPAKLKLANDNANQKLIMSTLLNQEQPQKFASAMAGAAARRALNDAQTNSINTLLPLKKQKLNLGNQELQQNLNAPPDAVSSFGKGLEDLDTIARTKGVNSQEYKAMSAFLNNSAARGSGQVINNNIGLSQLPNGQIVSNQTNMPPLLGGSNTPQILGAPVMTQSQSTDSGTPLQTAPLSYQTKYTNNKTVVNPVTGERTTVPTQDVTSTAEKAIINANAAYSNLQNYFNNTSKELKGFGTPIQLMHDQILTGLGYNVPNYSNYESGQKTDLTGLADELTAARGLNKNKALVMAQLKSIQTGKADTPFNLATNMGNAAANISMLSHEYDSALSGVSTSDKNPPSLPLRQSYLRDAFLGGYFPQAMSYVRKGLLENPNFPKSFKSQQDWENYVNNLNPAEKSAYELFLSKKGGNKK